MVNLNLSYNGNNLPENITQQLIDYAENTLNVPPSYLITKLHYEGLWGGSSVGQNNNNWGGMTWNNSWKSPYKRASGVTITRGSQRPSGEGGYYIKYETVNDFIKDWSHLIRKGGIYNVANSKTFDEAVKGMFKFGGAQYDYAIMDTTGSQRRYELYLQGMKARRTAINNANNGVLDELDKKNYASDPKDKEEIENEEFQTVVEKVEKDFDKLREGLNELENSFFDLLENIFNPKLYNYVNSNYKGNNFLTLEKLTPYIYKLKMGVKINKVFNQLQEITTEKTQEVVKDKDKETKKDDTSNPSPVNNKKPFFPHTKPYRITDTYRFRNNHPVSGKPVWHNGIDIADMTPGTSVPIFATQDGIVSFMDNGGTSSAGYWMAIEHTGDKYHSCYMHMASAPIPALGDTVKKGEKIGMTGATGGVTGVHLHFGVSTVKNNFSDHNVTIDPEKYLKMRF